VKQLLQNLRTGEGAVADVPVPVVQTRRVLVRTAASLVSTALSARLRSWEKGSLGKARERPELIGKVWRRSWTDELCKRLKGVRDNLTSRTPVGYSAAGIVIETAPDVTDFRAGIAWLCRHTTLLMRK